MKKNLIILFLSFACIVLIAKPYIASAYRTIIPQPVVATESQFYKKMTVYHERIAEQILSRSDDDIFAIVGNSIVQSWNFATRSKKVINLGIGSDTTDGVIARLNQPLINKIPNWYIAVGVNDPYQGYKIEDIPNRVERLADKFETAEAVYWQLILPSNEDGKTEYAQEYFEVFNSAVEVQCQLMKNCTLIDVPEGFEEGLDYLTSDGIHPNSAGYDMLNEHINSRIVKSAKN